MAVVYTNGVLKARATERVTATTASVGFTAAKYDAATTFLGSDTNFKVLRAEEVVITVETADLRWTVDGTTPTTTLVSGLGHLASAGDVLTITGYENIKNFRAINAVANNNTAFFASFFFRQ